VAVVARGGDRFLTARPLELHTALHKGRMAFSALTCVAMLLLVVPTAANWGDLHMRGSRGSPEKAHERCAARLALLA
jgi:hypothetical protein